MTAVFHHMTATLIRPQRTPCSHKTHLNSERLVYDFYRFTFYAYIAYRLYFLYDSVRCCTFAQKCKMHVIIAQWKEDVTLIHLHSILTVSSVYTLSLRSLPSSYPLEFLDFGFKMQKIKFSQLKGNKDFIRPSLRSSIVFVVVCGCCGCFVGCRLCS